MVFLPRRTKSTLNDGRSHTRKTFCSCITDRSWRVRWTVASNFGSLTNFSLTSEYVSLLSDSESEVRIAALSQLVGVCSEANKDAVLEAIGKVRDDPVDGVRGELAGAITGIAEVRRREGGVDNVKRGRENGDL